MTKKIRHIGPTYQRVQHTGPTMPRLEPSEVAAALGAEPTGVTLEESQSPLTLLVVRQEIVRRLQSSGGRPALSGTTRRTKIPLSDAEWAELEKLAKDIASPECAPTAGQVASVLLTAALRTVAEQAGDSAKDLRSALAEELAASAAVKPKQKRPK
jgi:hypothetical protein